MKIIAIAFTDAVRLALVHTVSHTHALTHGITLAFSHGQRDAVAGRLDYCAMEDE